jgi:hypothetical protein
MRGLRLLALCLTWALVAIGPAAADPPSEVHPSPAQTLSDQPAIPGADLEESLNREAELKEWMRAFASWEDWAERWRNTREPGWLAGTRARRPKPEPPVWLSGFCGELLDTTGVFADACRLLEEWRTEDIARRGRQRTAATLQPEDSRSLWWEHLHVDLLWPMTPWRTNVYGVVGMHASIEVFGRLHVFAAPGLMLLNLPGPNGREWTPATDWGLGYRLADFRLPGTSRPATLHVNFARAWILGDATNPIGRSVNLAGFSLTFKNNR